MRVDFDDLTVLIGKNDIGKSTILEALDIFFNETSGVVKWDKSDLNVQSAEKGENEAIISVCLLNYQQISLLTRQCKQIWAANI